ncbi:MAG: tetratricopeptide repeat protein, partial [Candidatus Margulisiibacteriota bacterium]
MGVLSQYGKDKESDLMTIYNKFKDLSRIDQFKYLSIFIIILVAFGVSANSLLNSFTYDDADQVLENKLITNIKYVPDIFLSNVWSFKEQMSSNYYRPLMHIVYMFNYHLFGLKPWGYHLTNILFHTGCSVLVLLIVLFLIKRANKDELSTDHVLVAFSAALLFAVHPIHTEAVTWVAGLPEVSFSFFYLGALYLYMKTAGAWSKYYWLSVSFFLLAMFCKEPAVTLPVLLFVYDLSFCKKIPVPGPKSVRSMDPCLAKLSLVRYLPYLAVIAIYLIFRLIALGGIAPTAPRHADLKFFSYIINIFPLFVQYLQKLVWPLDLNAHYVLHPVRSIMELPGLIALVISLGFGLALYFAKKFNGLLFFGMCLILLPLIPVLYIPVLGENTFAERYLYLPSVGFFIVLSVLALGILDKFGKRTLIASLIILASVYTFGTVKRNMIWRNDLVLWTDTVRKSPDSAIAQNNMGIAYQREGQFDKALEHFTTALKLDPKKVKAHNNMCVIYLKMGSHDEALSHAEAAMRISAGPDEYTNLANVYQGKGELAKALACYLHAIELAPEAPDAHANLGLLYYKQGSIDEAIKHYKLALAASPNAPETNYKIGTAYLKQGSIAQAIEYYQYAIKGQP